MRISYDMPGGDVMISVSNLNSPGPFDKGLLTIMYTGPPCVAQQDLTQHC
jgi:hypothetical protein